MNLIAAALFIGVLIVCAIGTHHWLNHVHRSLPRFGRATMFLATPSIFLLAGIGAVGRAFTSLEAGLTGSLILAFAFWAWSRRLAPEMFYRAALGRGERLAMVGALGFVGLVYAIISVKYQMHDEYALFGHKSMIEQIRNGVYPPYLPPFPEQSARYHYGFDVLAGILARGFGFSADNAIDFVTVYLALLTSLAAAAVTAQATPRRFVAAFSVIAIHFSSGLSWLILRGAEGRHPRCLVQYHHPTCGVDPFYPMPLLNMFQHPVALGIALFLVLILVSKPAATKSKLGRKFFAILLLLLPALALGQIVYFSLGVLAVLTALFFTFTKKEFRAQSGIYTHSMLFAGVLALGLGWAFLSGGMFTPSEVNQPGLIVRLEKIGFPANTGAIEMWRQHVANLGLGFVLLPIFGFVGLIGRNWTILVLSAFAHGGILVPHLWSYSRSWDIVKFPSAAAFALALLCVLLIDAQDWIQVWLRRTARLFLVTGGFLAMVYLIVPPEPKWRFYQPTSKRVEPLLGQTIEWWRANGYQKEDLVFSQSNIAPMLSIYGGLSVVGSDSDFHYLGIRGDILRQQSKHRRAIIRDLNEASLQALGVKWLMFSNEELNNLGPKARAELKSADSARFEQVAEFKAKTPARTRRIWRVVSEK